MVSKISLAMERLSVRRDGPILSSLGTLVLSTAVIWILLAGIFYLTSTTISQIRVTHLLIAILVCALVTLIYIHIIYRKTLFAIHHGILNAQFGTLKPICVPRVADVFLHRFVFDYNLLMTDLGSVFQKMEQSQNRVIGERNRNDAILHNLPGALICVDNNLKINLSNSQAEKLFQLPRDQLHGKNLFDVLQAEEEGAAVLREAFLSETQVANKEIFIRFGETTRYFALNLSFFQSRNLNEVGAALILQDITDYKLLLESTYNTEKLMAMGQLAAGVAHELNTPLGNIIGYAQLIRKAKTGEKQLQKHAQIVSDEAKRCSRIVEDLLSYARRDHCQAETCQLNQLIEEVVHSIIACQIKRYNVDVTMDLASKDPGVQGAAGQLDIVLVNLLMNAIQAVADSVKNPQVMIKSRVIANGTMTVMVEDNGPGVPPQMRRQIFDPFFTTKEVGKGTGLGLAISHAIVSRIGGRLKYDATQAKGACFILNLPLAQ